MEITNKSVCRFLLKSLIVEEENDVEVNNENVELCTSFSVCLVGTLVCGGEDFTKEKTSFILKHEQEWKDSVV